MSSHKRVSSAKEVGAQAPFFGVDLLEVELLRSLEKTVWMYVSGDASEGDLIAAANAVRLERRGRRKN